MKTELIIISAVLVLASVIVQPSYRKYCTLKKILFNRSIDWPYRIQISFLIFSILKTYSLLIEKTDCMVKRQAALRLVQQQDKNQSLNLAIVVPNCNDDGTYATLQCHHNSNFCQCWDKEGKNILQYPFSLSVCLSIVSTLLTQSNTLHDSGLPMTQPKKNLKKCSCYLDRAKALKTVCKYSFRDERLALVTHFFVRHVHTN